MSSEPCPFCGKSFKRLKSHLPHCKAAKSADPSASRHEATSESSASPLPPPQRAAKTETAARKPKQLKETLTKTTKRKLSEQIKTAAQTFSKNNTPTSSPNEKEPIRQVTNLNDKEVLENVNSVVAKSKSEKKKELKDLILSKKNGSVKAKVTVNHVKTSLDDVFWSTQEKNEKSLSEKDTWTSKREAKVTLHDVRTSLGRTKQNDGHKRNSVIDRLPSNELKSETINQHALVSLKHEVPSQIVAVSSTENQLVPVKSEAFPSDPSKNRNTDCSFSQRADFLKDGLRVDRHTMGLAALPSPARTFLEAEVCSDAFRKDDAANVKEANGETKQTTSKQDGQRCTRAGAQSGRSLGQVTLRELPDWLMSRWPSRPREALQMFQSGWQWYYRRYIDVKRGGAGGVAMLLAGYCVLSYVWAFPHLKRDRWRKYH